MIPQSNYINVAVISIECNKSVKTLKKLFSEILNSSFLLVAR